MIICICNRISSRVVEDYARRGLGVDALRADFGLASNFGQCLDHALGLVSQVQTRHSESYTGSEQIIASARA